MIRFTATIERYGQNGDKTGWTYILIPPDLAEALKPDNRMAFRVKGKLDAFKISGVAVMPVGNGVFMLPMNAMMRKGTGKRHGAMIEVKIQEDKQPYLLNSLMLDCLADEPDARKYFDTLTPSHQRYFSKYVDDAKTDITRDKRLVRIINALSRKMDYGAMLREKVQ